MSPGRPIGVNTLTDMIKEHDKLMKLNHSKSKRTTKIKDHDKPTNLNRAKPNRDSKHKKNIPNKRPQIHSNTALCPHTSLHVGNDFQKILHLLQVEEYRNYI